MMEMEWEMACHEHERPQTVLLEAGRSKEVVLGKFSERSSIEFACNVAGHIQAGCMRVNFNSADSRVRSLADASKPLNTAKIVLE